eukprot:8233075-Lingulodinium_polyedra.AAC.1
MVLAVGSPRCDCPTATFPSGRMTRMGGPRTRAWVPIGRSRKSAGGAWTKPRRTRKTPPCQP